MNATTLVTAVGEPLARASLQGAVLILVVLLIQKLLRRRLGPAWSFALWFLVLLRLSTPALPVSAWSWQRLAEFVPNLQFTAPSPAVVPATRGIPEPANPRESAPSSVVRRSTPASSPTTDVFEFGPATATTPDADRSRTGLRHLALWLTALWALGALGLLMRQGVGSWLFRRRLESWPRVADETLLHLIRDARHRMGVSRPIEFRLSSEIQSPCLFGVFRPVILLPHHLLHELTPGEWRTVLLHEFAHVKRLDPLWNAWMSLLRCVHWFNPLVWWAAARMREDRELACDALVLHGADSATRHSYGATLLKLAIHPTSLMHPAAMVGILENGGSLKARLQELKTPPKYWLNAALGIAIVITLGACALTQTPSPSANNRIQALDLSAHTDFPRPTVDPNALQTFRDDSGTWTQIPKGEQTFFGVPFDITGLIRLAGAAPQREEWYFRPKVTGIPVKRAFDRLYLLHATYYYAKPGTVFATARVNYMDGTSTDLPIIYGQHTLNYWRLRYEIGSQPTDPDSRVAWTGDAPFLAEYGNSLRLCISSLRNPHPKAEVRSIDLLTTWQDPTEVVVGMAVGGRELPPEWRNIPPIHEPDQKWDSHLRFRAVDSVTSEPIPNLKLRVEVADEGVHSRIGTYTTDENGWADLKYPHAKLHFVGVWANHDRYTTKYIQWTRKQHGEYPAEYIYRAEPGVRAAGRVEDQNGQPVAGAMVRIDGPRANLKGDAKEFLMPIQINAITDAAGRWSAASLPREVPARQMMLRVLHPDLLPISPVLLSGEQLAGAEINTRLPGGVVITGVVLNSQKQPLPGAKILARRSPYRGDAPRGATADKSGAFNLRLPPGATAFDIMIEADGYAPLFETLSQDQTTRPITPFVLSSGRTVDVLVQDALKRPIEGVLIEGSGPGDFTVSGSVLTDASGRAKWQHVVEGQLTFHAHRGGYRWNQSVLPAGVTNATVVLVPTESLSGTVTDRQTGLPIPYFKVWVGQRSPNQDEIDWRGQPVALGRGGVFRIVDEQLHNDNQIIRIDAPGYASTKPIPAASLRSAAPFPIKLDAK